MLYRAMQVYREQWFTHATQKLHDDIIIYISWPTSKLEDTLTLTAQFQTRANSIVAVSTNVIIKNDVVRERLNSTTTYTEAFHLHAVGYRLAIIDQFASSSKFLVTYRSEQAMRHYH